MFVSLPLNPRNEFDKYFENNNYTYLVISKVSKPKTRSKKTEGDYKAWEEQQETINRLNTNHYNCYNKPISPQSIKFHITSIIQYFNNYIVYKIKPTSCVVDKGKYLFYEFDIINKFDNIEDILNSLVDDFIICECFAKIIDDFSFCNKKNWDSFYSIIKSVAPEITSHLFLTDIIKCLNLDFYSNIKDDIIYNLLQSGDIIPTSKYENKDYNLYLKTFINLSLFKSLTFYTKEKLKTTNICLSDESILTLQRHADNVYIDELITILNPQFNVIKLIITKTTFIDDGYDSKSERIEVDINDVNDAKMYIAKNYDISFMELQKDIDKIYIRQDEETEYSFDICF